MFAVPGRLVGFYPLDSATGGRDISLNKAPTAKLSNTRPAKGPDGTKRGATTLLGEPNSYIEIPNNGKLDAKDAITICAYIQHDGNAGPIVNFKRGPAWGVHFWMAKPKVLFARFVSRNGKMTQPIFSKPIVPRRAWSFVCTSYDKDTGVAKLWLNGSPKKVKKVGRFSIATKEPIRIGAKIGDSRTFRGKIACVQIYSAALFKRQVRDAMRRCTKRGKHSSVAYPEWSYTLFLGINLRKCCIRLCIIYKYSFFYVTRAITTG